MHYYEVLPLVKTGAENQAFTYEFEEELNPGNLVTIPLRKRFVKGLITAKVKKPDFQTRPLNKVLTKEPPVTETQLEIAKKMSDLYFCELGEAINAIFPFEFGKKRRVVAGTDDQNDLESKLELTPDQELIVRQVSGGHRSEKYLLFGVTGSGKTEIYLQLIAEALKKDQGSIVLVPEIALTPQTLSRFQKRFGDKVAVWHSDMKETEKYNAWEKIKSGEKMILVGARSAIFAPIKNLAYIIIDEEHEGSYKQDQTPRYEAGQIAEWLAEATGAKVVLGSATPKLESYYRSQAGEYKLLELNKRIVQEEMPPVKIIDLRDEFKKGNKSIFSEALIEASQEAIKDGKQVLFFVNRRGAATFVVCRDCGYVSTCPNCDTPLTYHPSEGQVLKCHHCNYRTIVPALCPTCGSLAIKFFGLGTQKAELEAQKIFPGAKVARMDTDTTKTRGSHQEYYNKFKEGSYDILIGTQMIAKGWDLPNVAVVGVISADTTLNIPDFRSAERTFSLLTQVAGRTGRGFHPGKVFVQTYNPENYAILAAAKHDYRSFYEKEIKIREKYCYPPFSNLLKLSYSNSIEEKALNEATELAKAISSLKIAKEVLGPVPAFIPKVGSRYRFNIIIKSKNSAEIKKLTSIIKPQLKKGWIADVHPGQIV